MKMGTLVETDIDHFIRERKSKLQQEREHLAEKDRYPSPEPQVKDSPRGRKQWDKGKARDARPLEEQVPRSPRETGLPLSDNTQQQKKQKLMNERQREYNDMLAKAPAYQKRRPKTPANTGLPLGGYEEKRRALARERQEDMRKEMARTTTDAKTKVFDYNETKKAHLEEKKREYNEFLAQQAKKGRHIITPEQGMFIGPDQTDRTKIERERNFEHRRALEKQHEKQLLLRARESGQIPYPSPRKDKPPPYPHQDHIEKSEPERNVPPLGLEDSSPRKNIHPSHPHQDYGEKSEPERKVPPLNFDERLIDMPNISPRRHDIEKDTSPRLVYKPHHPQRRHFHDESSRKPPVARPSKDPVQSKEREEKHGEHDLVHSKDCPVHGKDDRNTRRSKDDSFIKEAKEKYQWYNERHLSPPLPVRRSRSLSPPLDMEELHREIEQKRKELQGNSKHPVTDPRNKENDGQNGENVPNQDSNQDENAEKVEKLRAEKEKLRRIYETQMAQKQQQLQEEYRREVDEDQRIAADRARADRDREQNIDFERQKALLEERKKGYQELLAQKPRRISLRKKEVTPEYLRLGLPLDQARHDEERKILLTERKKEYNEILSKQPPPRQKLPTPDEVGLNVGENELERQKQLFEERKKEYNELIAQQQPKDRRGPAEGTDATLPVGEYDEVRRQKLYEERHNEYLQLQQQKLASERQRGLPPKPATPNHFFKNIGEHERKAQVLQEERKKEYNQRLAVNRVRTRGEVGQGAEDYVASVPIKPHDSAELRKMKQRNEEYKAFLEEKKVKDQHRLDHKKPPTDRHGAQYPTEKPQVQSNKDTYASLPGLGYSDSAEMRKVKERNKEYNEYIQQKGPPGPRRGWQTPTYEEILEQKRKEELQRRQAEDPDYEPSRLRPYASDGALNRLQDDFRGRELDKELEARKVRFEESRKYGGILDDDNWLNPERREQEYQSLNPTQDLPDQVERPVVEERDNMAARVDQRHYLGGLPIGEAKGLPVGYDERDSAKRRKQSNYRRELEVQIEEEAARRKREKVQELRVNASGFCDPEKSSKRIKGLGGEPGVSPRREYKANEVQRYHSKFLVDDSDEHDAVGRPLKGGTGHRGLSHLGNQYHVQPLGKYTIGGLPSADNDSLSREPTSAQTRFREDSSQRPQGILANPRNAPYSAGLDSLAPRDVFSPQANSDNGDNLRLDFDGGGLGGVGGLDRGRRRDRDLSILDSGFTGLLQSRRNVGAIQPPPGLQYQASSDLIPNRLPVSEGDKRTYVTAGGAGGPLSSIDDAYHYYGMRNPLDVGDMGGGGGGLALNLGGSDYGGPAVRGSPTPRVTFADEPHSISYRKRDRSRERISPYQFDDPDGRSKSRQDTLSYQQELERQIAEKRYKKQLEKEEQMRYERKLEEDIRNYNPFGRGGGGAPIKDASGQAIADLRSLQRGQVEPSPRRGSPVLSPRPPSPRDDKIKPPPMQQNAIGESTYARGGHGIFGQPKTEAEKDVSEKYKDELREQIADKRRREQMEKERERMEEEKENRRLEEQRLRMQTEYDEEQKKIRAREEETRRKNEELKRQAEERKKEQDRQRMEADDARMREQQAQMERERQEREQQQQQQQEEQGRDRLKSPPVPAVRAKREQGTSTSRSNSRSNSRPVSRKNSPPVPALRAQPDDSRTKSPALPTHRTAKASPAPTPTPQPGVEPVQRSNSSDVLTQLASMRQQLQSERRRVENQLERSKNEPDVFDPRVIQRPPPHQINIFEKAVNKNATLPPPRAQTSDIANAKNLQRFNELKNTETESKRAFRRQYPDAPITNVNLESQQDAMLQQQEATLRAIREGYPFDETPGPSQTSIGRQGNASARSHLPASSAFIDVDGVNQFPEDFEDLPIRNDSARARRRDRFPSPRPDMGSQTSLDVDRIQRKNEERLRRLQNMNNPGDDLSLGDPDDILERFMAKQRYNRPPTQQTLQNDTWMRPGSKPF